MKILESYLQTPLWKHRVGSLWRLSGLSLFCLQFLWCHNWSFAIFTINCGVLISADQSALCVCIGVVWGVAVRWECLSEAKGHPDFLPERLRQRPGSSLCADRLGSSRLRHGSRQVWWQGCTCVCVCLREGLLIHANRCGYFPNCLSSCTQHNAELLSRMCWRCH